MFASIDGAIDKLERQISSYKGRAFSHKAVIPEGALAGGSPASSQVVKAKRFELKPTSVEEAAMQIDLLQHDFYVFRNAETEEINIIYRRKDGNLGLIEPI
jgi:putative sigma-54 modulation protein